MLDMLSFIAEGLWSGFSGIFIALFNPSAWLDWSDPVAKMRFIYYGGSTEFFFAVMSVALIITAVGLFYRQLLWNMVRGIEWTSNTVGRFFAWAGLLMVLQQVMIVFLQRIFRVSEISLGFGIPFTRDLSWFSEELKLYNAMIIALCTAYTLVQGGHVRVDLFYAGMRHRGKRIVDMIGSLVFLLPTMTLVWFFGWFFMWRHLVTPKINSTDTLMTLERKARLLKWNVETIGFSPNGFDAYFLFKVLMVAFAGLMFVQGLAFFWRSLLEYIEGEDAADKYSDFDVLDDEIAEKAAASEGHEI
jgi:TRAP-type mannitol/chloroaromatic compound transport system permease small subunit